MEKRKVFMAEMGILLVAIFWGMGFVSAKFVLEDMDPFNLLAYRYLFSFIAMALIGFKSIKKITKKTFKAGFIIGSIMFFGNVVQTIGLQYTTPGKQTFIICMYTVLVPLLSWVFFREKTSKKMILAAAVAFVGIGLLTLQDDLSIGYGDALTFIFAITFSIHVILVGRFMKDLEPVSFAVVQIGVCAAFSILGGLAFGGDATLADLNDASWLGMAQLVLLNTVLAFLIQNACQKIAPANHVAILMSTEVVFGTFFTIVFTGEVFTHRMILGCILVGVALVISNWPVKSEKPPEETLLQDSTEDI